MPLAGIQRRPHVPEPVLLRGGTGSQAGGSRLLPEKRQVVERDLHGAGSQLVPGKAREHRPAPHLAGRTLEVLVEVDRHQRTGIPEHESIRGDTRWRVSDRHLGGVPAASRYGAEGDGERDDRKPADEPDHRERPEPQPEAGRAPMATITAMGGSLRSPAFAARGGH